MQQTTSKTQQLGDVEARILALPGVHKRGFDRELSAQLGELLDQARKLQPKPSFGKWVENHLPFSHTTARACVTCWDFRDHLDELDLSRWSVQVAAKQLNDRFSAQLSTRVTRGRREPPTENANYRAIFDLVLELNAAGTPWNQEQLDRRLGLSRDSVGRALRYFKARGHEIPETTLAPKAPTGATIDFDVAAVAATVAAALDPKEAKPPDWGTLVAELAAAWRRFPGVTARQEIEHDGQVRQVVTTVTIDLRELVLRHAPAGKSSDLRAILQRSANSRTITLDTVGDATIRQLFALFVGLLAD